MTQPRTIPMNNLVVFGDSLSDIGIMSATYLGMVAKTLGAMTTNETGRYSDGRNWTDFLYEWIGSDTLLGVDAATTVKKSGKYQTLTANSLIPLSNSTIGGAPICYANLAQGGAVAASDVPAMGGTLSTLSTQCDRYIDQRRALGPAFTGPALHIIWIGLNDIVTCNRPDTPDGPELVYDNAPPDVATLDPLYRKYPADKTTPLLAEHNPEYFLGKALEDTTAGQGVLGMVYDIVRLCNRIVAAFPDDSHLQHFMFVPLPDPNMAPRIVEMKAKGQLAQVKRYVDLTVRFNKILRCVALAGWQETGSGVLPQNLTFVPIYDRLRYISSHPQQFGLKSKAQLATVKVKYGGTEEDTDDMAQARNFFTTTDAAHPTQAVYKLIALQIADTLIAKGYGVGRLNPARWAQDRKSL